MRHADEAHRRAGPRDSEGGAHGGVRADTLEYGVRTHAVGEIQDALLALLAALRDEMGGAELFRDPLPRLVS